MQPAIRMRVNAASFGTLTKPVLRAQLVAMLRPAVQHIAEVTTVTWQEAVHRAKLWSGEREAYASSIQWRWVGGPDDLKAEVYTDYRHAQQIDEGRPAYDLKRMLDSSLKVRTTKKGRRYLIIPFRHNTPGHTGHSSDMPDHVYAMAKKLNPSMVTGMTTRASGTGAHDITTRKVLTVPQAQYSWGGRLAAGSMGPNQRRRVDRFAGMVRMLETSTAGKKRSVYLTFRVMVEGGKGWIIPPRPGLRLVPAVISKVEPLSREAFQAALSPVTL